MDKPRESESLINQQGPSTENSRLLKVVIFADNSLCVNALNMLLQQQQLAGVVLPPQQDAFSQKLQVWLQQMNIAHIQYIPEQTVQMLEQLKRWEADLAISFSTQLNLTAEFSALFHYGLYYCHCSAFPAYHGPMPLYWQLRDMCSDTQITLQKANVFVETPMLSHDIALTHKIPIDRLDTLQALEHKVTVAIAPVINQFLQQLMQQQGNIPLTVAQGTVSNAPQVEEQDLKVDWASMDAEQISALARAGNPQMGGCIVTLGNTDLNLLQATEIEYTTYGVCAGTLCHTGEPYGVIVATIDGAIRLDILSNADGIFGAVAFCEKFQISAGMAFA